MSKFITQINTSEDIYTMYSLESFYFDICNEGFGDTIKSGIDSMCKNI